MATFKAVVQQHQQRKDGKYPISIIVTNNRKSCYVSTGLYCTPAQINKKSFEIKDQFIIAKINHTIRDWERRLLTIDATNISQMTTKNLKKILTVGPDGIDFIAEMRELVDSNPLKWRKLYTAMSLLKEMRITDMDVKDFNSDFIRKFKEFLDKKSIPVTKNGIIVGCKQYSQNTKKDYLSTLCQMFRLLQRKYNTEYNQVISHNPFYNFEGYRSCQTAKRSMSVEQVRAFFDLPVRIKSERETLDLMKLSFCLCGINLIDIFDLKKSAFDRKNMRITYERHKTKDRSITRSLTSVHVEPEIYAIIERYKAPKSSDMLFDFKGMAADYASTFKMYNRVTRLCEKYNFEHITPYWFRHTWATIARNECEVSKDDIDLCLAHSGNNPMADVYIRPDWSRVDRANRKVLDLVFGPKEDSEDGRR